MLREIGDKYECGKAYQGYLDFYEFLFGAERLNVKKVLEIGVRFGQSLNMWEEYFPNAIIYGIDIEDCSKIKGYCLKESDRIITYIGDQSDRKQMQKFIDTYGGEFDIIIEDGGHSVILQQISLGFFFKHLKIGGFYSIEDLDVSCIYRGGKFYEEENLSNTTYTMLKDVLMYDRFHSRYMEQEEQRFLNANADNCMMLYHRADGMRYEHLNGVNDKNFSLCVIRRKY